MRSGRRQPPNHRLANIQKRRSALLSPRPRIRRCSTSNCCRKQRFSAINRVFGLNIAAMAHSRSRNTRPSGRSSASRSDSPAICQRQRGRRLFCAPQAKPRDCQPQSLWTAILRPTRPINALRSVPNNPCRISKDVASLFKQGVRTANRSINASVDHHLG
jgi:hypothetical protein